MRTVAQVFHAQWAYSLVGMFQERLTFKDFSIFSSGRHLVYPSGRILAILVGSHLGNIPMKSESHWPKGSGVQEELAFKTNC